MRYRLVIFDMDGTLTEELLDFAAIRAEIGVVEGGGILEHIRGLMGVERGRAEEILHRHEMAAAETCELHEGAVEVLRELGRLGVGRALLTRNSAACAARVLGRHGLSQAGLDHISSREDEPHKPHPESILRIVKRFGVLREQTLMVGDYLYDVEAARNAGVDSALFCGGYDEGEDGVKDGVGLPAFAKLATYRIWRLDEVVGLVNGVVE